MIRGKNIFLYIFFVFFALGFFFPFKTTARLSQENSTAWERLKEKNPHFYLKVYYDKSNKSGHRMVKSYIVDINPIRKALEEAGIGETVIIEIRCRKEVQRLIANLGKYTPLVGTKNGETVIKFHSMPESKDIPIPLRVSRSKIAVFESMADNFIWLNVPSMVVFKNAEKKNKARINIEFRYMRQENSNLPVKSVKSKRIAPFDLLLKLGYLHNAEAFCARQKKKYQQECYRKLADAFFKTNNIEKALEYMKKSNYKAGLNKVAVHYFEKGEYKKAMEYFEQGMPSITRVRNYEALAEEYENKENRPDLAKAYYIKAIRDIETLLKSLKYQWKNEYFEDLRRCLAYGEKYPKSEEERAQRNKLDKILEKAAAYCQRLKDVAILFFCKEHVVEKINYGNSLPKRLKVSGRNLPRISDVMARKKYLFEYQLFKEGKTIEENRILLKKNGVKKKDKDARLNTWGYHYEKLIFGPVALLSEPWQSLFEYRFLQEITMNGEKVAIIEAIPQSFHEKNHLFGKIWVKMDDFSILKIEWIPKSIKGIYKSIRKKALIFKGEPDVTFFVEYNIEKNGIRFPSRYYISEAYMKKKGKRFIHLELDVRLKDYMFFSVGTDVIDAYGQ